MYWFGFVRVVQQPLVENEVFQTFGPDLLSAAPAEMPSLRRTGLAFSGRSPIP